MCICDSKEKVMCASHATLINDMEKAGWDVSRTKLLNTPATVVPGPMCYQIKITLTDAKTWTWIASRSDPIEAATLAGEVIWSGVCKTVSIMEKEATAISDADSHLGNLIYDAVQYRVQQKKKEEK